MTHPTLTDSYFPRLLNGPPFTNGEDMKFEALRLKTFNSWPAFDKASPIRLVKTGFLYTGNDDIVTCFVCRVCKGGWNKDMKPEYIHRELNPSCRFLVEEDSLNIPIFVPQRLDYQEILDTLHRKYCGNGTAGPNQATHFSQARDNPDYFSASFSSGSISRTPSFPVVASDAGPPETSQQAIGGIGHRFTLEPEPAPVRETHAVMKQELNRFNSFGATWPRDGTPDTRDLARSGFFYTGTADRVQCVFCRGILRNWDEDDVPAEEHRRHFPTCPFVIGGNCGNIPDPNALLAENRNNEFMQVAQSPAVVSDASLGIVTERPKHPNYAVEQSRVNSFRNWPSGKEQTPLMLAKAGFYYAGFGDSVKCFFCDGGLRTWESGDDPWTEHARWFPRCAYVRQVKGEEFIQEALEGRENGAAISGMIHESRGLHGAQGDHTTVKKSVPAAVRQVDPRELSARMDSPMVQTVLTMDIPRERVSRAIFQRLQETGDDFPSIEALMEAIFQLPEDPSDSTVPAAQHVAGPSSPEVQSASPEIGVKGDAEERSMDRSSSEEDDDSQSLIEENRQLKEQRQCKICMDEEVNVVFLPCGHLVCCATCAPALRKCPICRANIRGTVRTFMS